MANLLRKFYTDFWLLNMIRAFFTPYMIEKKKEALLFDDSMFYRINLNCRGDACYGYANIEDRRTKARVFVSPMHKLPFYDNKVKLIFVDFETIKNYKNLGRIFKEWSRILVPNGILSIDNIELNEDITGRLSILGFNQVFKGSNSQKYLPVAYFTYTPVKEFKEKTPPVLKPDSDKIELKNMIEYIRPDRLEEFLKEAKSGLKPGGRLELSIKNEVFMEGNKFISFFDKGNLAQFLTEAGFLFEKIELVDKNIEVIVKKKETLALKIEKPKRICAIGQYMMIRYNQLGFDWDGIPRAMDELGYDYILLEGMRNMDYKILHKAILAYGPDYILLVLKETLPILFDIAKDLKKMGTKTIFWFTDPDTPWQMDLNGILDYMFLSNTGQLEDYKKAFNIKNVYFMAQPCTPSIMHRCNLPEIYDVGFTGALSKDKLHDTRRKVVNDLSGKYNVAVRNNMRNHVSEFYSQSKIVFGASDFKYELYTSNRIFVAMSCQRLYLTNKFPGIERLFKNKEHLLWFENYSEAMDIVDYYLKHDSERNRIAENAARIAHAKHTYKERLKNIFDIVEGKTDNFYGFLE
ncbi:MAG: glycosyltransferase [Candidatus Omnitrophota bacterium]